ncbi:MAG: ABC transporter permease [Bacteroidota bacterium]|nr:ABC transporter permease [Bacteroidota bacterium]MDP4234078.1 ABC transporter permease [Bacteroidota bacterium]MDP4243019.1 ABC transporter permease [Bacteroidota bacterium]MDP4287445.1 ABC transporter permease [Bacteroidota bacterium]
MSTERIYAILLRVLYLMRGSFTRVVPLFAWAAIDIVLWGFITRYLNSVSHSGMNFVSTMLGAVLLWDFFTRAMFGVTTSFFEDVWSRNFLNLFATPLKTSEYLTGLVLSSVLTSFFGLVVMLVLATLVFGLSFFAYGALFVPFVMVLFLFGIALGILSISIVLRLGPAAEWFIWPMPAILAPVAAVFYPISVLPEPLQWIARLLPASYVFEGLRAIAAHEAAPVGILAIGGVLSIFYIVLSGWVFARTYRYAVRTGLIARYSAETVS